MKQLTLSFLLMLLPLLASADPVEIDGIWYNLVNKTKTAEVTRNPNLPSNQGSYTGDIIIPQHIIFDDEKYDITTIGESAFVYCNDVVSINVPNSVTGIGTFAFSHCGMTTITITNSVTNIERFAFYECCKLTSITLPNNVTCIEESTFHGCSSLTSITIPNSVTSIGRSAFSYCSGLTSITIPNSVTTIERGAFYGCSGLTSITIPNSVTSIDGVFSNCSGLTAITIPNSVTSINGAFYGCSDLTSITIPNSVTSIGDYTFYGCKSLTSITIPNSVTSIGDEAFSYCSSLASISIPDNVTTIGEETFTECPNLATIIIGKGIRSIGSRAFSYCPHLNSFYCYAEEFPSFNANIFSASGIQNASLYVLPIHLNVYKTTYPWYSFKYILSTDDPNKERCAKPTITIENGKVKFTCETEGVEFVSSVSAPDAKNYDGSELSLSYKYNVSVYAIKEGYENSETATAEITASGKFGDMNHDNKITVADAVIIIDKVMKNEE